MTVRETLLETVRCAKNRGAHMVEDSIVRYYVRRDIPEKVTHTYRCQDFAPCTECMNCKYHQ
jgi:hypothetical protein